MIEFERFLANLQTLLEKNQTASVPAQTQTQPALHPPRDAIDTELARPARTTAVVSLKDAAEVEAFRNELIDGLIRVDTANQLLRLANEVITRLL